MEYKIAEMTLARYDELIAFWNNTDSIYVSDDDEYERLDTYLKRNPGSNFIVLYEDRIIATVKCSHDGRRGYIHHLVVDKDFRKRGIDRELIDKCIGILREKGIGKCRVFVYDRNTEALNFWKYVGFEERAYDYRTFQSDI